MGDVIRQILNELVSISEFKRNDYDDIKYILKCECILYL